MMVQFLTVLQAWNNINLVRLAEKIKSPLVLYHLCPLPLDWLILISHSVVMFVRRQRARYHRTTVTLSCMESLWYPFYPFQTWSIAQHRAVYA